MIFNKKICRTKHSPFVLEYIGLNIVVTIMGILFMLLAVFSAILSGNNTVYDNLAIIAIIGGILLLSPLGMYFTAHNAFLQAIYLRKKSKSSLKTNDVVLVACGNENVSESNYGYTSTTLYLFFREPYILKGEFMTLPYGTEIVHIKPFSLNFPPHWTYRFQKDYEWYKEEYMKSLPPNYRKGAWQGKNKNPNINRYNEEMYDSFALYLTYEKVQVLNRLFALVDPPEFRVVTVENARVLKELLPIPCKEYPPEALECMKKINAMYP